MIRVPTGTWRVLTDQTIEGESTFGIFDAFADEPGREAHLNGEIAAALMEKAPELLASDPKIEKVDVLADKLPG